MLKTLSCLVGMEGALASSNLVFTVAVDKFGGVFLFLFFLPLLQAGRKMSPQFILKSKVVSVTPRLSFS